jgi:hypothetical protein
VPSRRSKLVLAALVCSNVAAALALGLDGLQWWLADRFWLFALGPYLTAGAWFFGGSALLAVVTLLVRARHEGWDAARPVLVLLVAAALVSADLPGRAALEVDFRLYRAERERVVELVRSGQLRPAGTELLLPLPAPLAHLSRSGEIEVLPGERPAVLFYTFRGLLDHYSGFAYGDGDAPPEPGDEIPWRWTERRGDHWWSVGR